MSEFPRTTVGGVSMPRLIIGTNWFRGFSHNSVAKDKYIREMQTPERIAETICVFLENGVDAIMGGDMPELMDKALTIAEQKVGREVIRIITPHFNIIPGGPAELEPERVLDRCKAEKATFCLPHQCVTDALIDRMHGTIRDLGKYTKMIRERGMHPGLSTHMPEAVVYADKMDADVDTYIQIYNSANFLMQVEADWIMRIINSAKKPVMTIKPLAAGRLQPAVGLAFVWNTIRDCDMVTIGCTTPDEAREVIDISWSYLMKRTPDVE
ncbi:MAG: hypothetical protein JXR97_16725, partial [Planctomycetes bacterium]|nr:hypothetical protein [Planctomycetota bacterium]